MRRDSDRAAHGLTPGASPGSADCSGGSCQRHAEALGAGAQLADAASPASTNQTANGFASNPAATGLPSSAPSNGSPASSAAHGLASIPAAIGSPASNGSPANPASDGSTTNGAHPRLDRAPAIVCAAGFDVGGSLPVLIGSIGRGEDGEALGHAARSVAEVGGQFLHWGTIEASAASYGGEPLAGLSLARKTADAYGLGLVGDVEAAEDIAPVAELADLIHVPRHLMQCFALLLEAGRAGRPVILSRSPAATLEEWLLAAEYLLVGGCPGIVLCEAGIRGFDHPDRPVLDLGAVATLRLTHQLPVIVAPGRAAGRPELIQPLARAALAAGAHGLVLPFLPRGVRP